MMRSKARAWTAHTARTVRAAVVFGALMGLSALPSGQSPADVMEPAVRITSPGEDATVSGTVAIIAEATDEGGVAGVIFEVDGRPIGAEVVSAPWSIAWNTSTSGNGSHILTAIARDVAGNAVRSAVVPVVVGGDPPPPFPPPTNHNPTPTGDVLTSAGRVPVTFTGALLLVNDTDPDGHSISITLVASSSSDGGTIVSHGSDSYTYTPAAAFTGVDRFTYSITDGLGGTATAAVSVNVTAPTPINQSPTPVGDAFTSTGGTSVIFTGASLLVNDTDPDGHTLSIMLVDTSSTEGGTIVGNGDESYVYTPAAGFSGVDRFTYSVADGYGGSATATATVTVTAATTPASAGLVLSLGFDEASGLAALDASGGGRNGAIRGALRVPGRNGGALQFDGVDDWVTVPDAAALDLTTGMTLEAWVNPTAAMSGWDTIMLKERGSGDLAYALYANDGAPAPAGYVNVGGAHASVPGTGVVPQAAWTHLAATYDGAALRLYVNGALASTRARTGPIVASGGALRIGGNNAWPGEFFGGLIDDVRIYNRALTATEIAAGMNGDALPPPLPPLNHPPVAQSDSLTTATGTPVSFTASVLLANDTDDDNDALNVSSTGLSSVNGGVIALSGAGAWTYTPAGGYSGADSFTYAIADGHGGIATGTVNVTVTPATPPPAGAEGLVLALDFDEASGATAFDMSGGERHGTIREALRVPGKHGGALKFDGINDWVSVTDTTASSLDLTTGLTIEAWVNPEELSGWETVVLKERGAGLLSYGLYAHDGGPLAGGEAVPAGYVRAGGADRAVRGTGALPLNTWTHLAVTYDGATQRLYVNGSLVGSRPQTGPTAAGNGALRIGGNNAFPNEFFRGAVDEVRIYNRALSASEIGSDMSGRQ